MVGMTHSGKLVYLMGPSGSGKDSLLAAVRMRRAGALDFVFPRRYITRSEESGGEDHIPVDNGEFERMERNGCFSLSWESHGLRYGISKEIDADLAQGQIVVVNGSREYFPEALRRYPNCVPVLITVDPGVLRARLLARGRENGPDLEARLERAKEFVPHHPRLQIIDNSGDLEQAVGKLSVLLTSLLRSTVFPLG